MGTSDNGPKWAAKQMFTTGEAAEICRVSQQTIIRCFDKGRLHGFRVPGSRFRKIPRIELLRFMRENDIRTDVLEPPTRRILVVDDDERVIALINEALGGDVRFEVQIASNGYDAGVMTERFKPHLILLDQRLPDVNVSLVCQRVRASADLAGTKLLIVSTNVGARELERLTVNGADGFVSKPLKTKSLVGRIAKLLELQPAPPPDDPRSG